MKGLADQPYVLKSKSLYSIQKFVQILYIGTRMLAGVTVYETTCKTKLKLIKVTINRIENRKRATLLKE